MDVLVVRIEPQYLDPVRGDRRHIAVHQPQQTHTENHKADPFYELEDADQDDPDVARLFWFRKSPGHFHQNKIRCANSASTLNGPRVQSGRPRSQSQPWPSGGPSYGPAAELFFRR